jgi:YVTN family beta-propeller protein
VVRNRPCPEGGHPASALAHPARRLPLHPSVLLLTLLIPTLLIGQQIEGYVRLPDSLGGDIDPQRIVVSPDGRYAYVGGFGNCISVVDVQTGERVARFPASGDAGVPCVSTVGNRVFFPVGTTDTVFIVDCATNTLAGATRIRPTPGRLCYNPTENKVYCSVAEQGTIVVIDGTTGQRQTNIIVGTTCGDLCCSPTANKVYVETRDTMYSVVVIDCSADTVLRRMAPFAGPLVCNPSSNKLYAADTLGIGAIDCATDSVLRSFRLPTGTYSHIACDPVLNRIYYAEHAARGSFVAVDGNADTVLAVMPLYQMLPHFDGLSALACDTSNGKVYVTADRWSPQVAVIDGATLAIDTAMGIASIPDAACSDPALGRTVVGGHVLMALDGETDTVLWRCALGVYPTALCYSQTTDKLYVLDGDHEGSLSVVDCATNTTRAFLWAGHYPADACADPVTGKVYCSIRGDDVVKVIDGAADTVRTVIPVGDGPWDLTYVDAGAAGKKVYCSNFTPGGGVSVIDAEGDSMLRTIAVPSEPMNQVYAPERGRLYCAFFGAYPDVGFSVIDVATDSLLATVGTPMWCWAVCYDRSLDRFYYDGGTEVIAYDGKTNQALDTIPMPGPPTQRGGVVHIEQTHRIYHASSGTYAVHVIDCLTDSIVDTIRVAGENPVRLVADATGRYLYCTFDVDSIVSVIDTRTDSVVRTLNTRAQVTCLASDPIDRRVYLGSPDVSGLIVLRDSVTGIGEEPPVQPAERFVSPTVLRQGDRLHSRSPALLFDACGRVHMKLVPGQNELGDLATGVYFLRDSLRRSGKVVVAPGR